MEQSLAYIREEREYLSAELRQLGYKVFESDTNYLLIKGAPGLFEKLLAGKILVRDCSNFEGLGAEYIRIAVRLHEDNEELIRQIAEVTHH